MNQTKGLVIFLIVIAAAGMGLLALSKRPMAPNATTGTGNIGVVASFYPIANFAQNVGGDRVHVTNVTPSGVEPHDFEPTPQDIASAYDAKLFVYNGAGMDAWAETLAPSLEQQGIKTVKLSEAINVQLLAPQGDIKDELAFDPHIWMDPVLAKQQVAAIRDALIAVDPDGAETYNQNAASYLEKLDALDASFRAGLASCQKDTVVTSHAAFGYLAERYGFHQLAITGLSPDEEPSPATLADITAQAKQHEITYVFFETLVNPSLAQTLATEIGAKTLVFNPLEGLTDDEIAAGEDYISVMQKNLAALKIALVCP